MKRLSPPRSPTPSELLKETVGSKLSDRKGDYADFEFKVTKPKPKVTLRHSCGKLRTSPEKFYKNCSSEATRVLLQILLEQKQATVQEYTLNSVTFKVFVVEDTEL